MNKPVRKQTNPWSWVPSLYFAEGLPYAAVIFTALVMYKRMGLNNAEITFYTSWMYLPWVLKPLWSPFVDIIGTRRRWVVVMQGLMGAALAGIAFALPTAFWLQLSLAMFWLVAFASATHDIAADGFYIISLPEGEQSFFVGIRNTLYRIALTTGQGLLVVLAGLLEQGTLIGGIEGNIPLAWSLTFYFMAALMIGLALWHARIMPRPAADRAVHRLRPGYVLRSFAYTFLRFVRKPHVALMFFFILTYRLGEAQLARLSMPFLIDDVAAGGLGLKTATAGIAYGTIGPISLLLGGILGGILVSRHGLGRWLIPMALAINAPDLLYVLLAALQPDGIVLITLCIAIEQLGYGFGFAAFTLYLIYVAQGKHSTAHYAIGTGLMALGMMIPGLVAGWLQQHLGYTLFFVWVCVSTLPGIAAAVMVKKVIPESFGKKKQ